MTSHACHAIPRSTLLTYSLGFRDGSRAVTETGTDSRAADEMSGVAEHVRTCGACRHLVRRLRNSRQALRTLGLPGLLTSLATSVSCTTAGATAEQLPPLDARAHALRGRILGAARDRAWGLLSRQLQELLETSRGFTPHVTSRFGWGHDGTEAREQERWNEQRAAVGSLARRLEGLGIYVDLSDLPPARPSAPALPWVIRHLDDLLKVVGGGDAEPAGPDAYQPSEAPSFLDSLPPL